MIFFTVDPVLITSLRASGAVHACLQNGVVARANQVQNPHLLPPLIGNVYTL